MEEKDAVMKIMILNKLGLIYKSTPFSDSKEDNVITVLSTSKDFGVNMLVHPTKLILLKLQTLLIK